MAVGAVAAPQAASFGALVQAAWNGSTAQTIANGILSVLGKVLSTLVAHKFKTLGVVGLVITAYVYRAEIKAQWDKCMAGCAGCASSGGDAAGRNSVDNKDNKQPATK